MNWRLIEKRLLEMGISDERFAADLDCCIGTVQNMKRGRGVNLNTALKVASYLGLRIEDLAKKPDMPKPASRKAAS